MADVNGHLGVDLLVDDDADLVASPSGDLALTPSGRACLLQDIRHLLETLPGDLYGHPDYGAGLGRLVGENGRNAEAMLHRAVLDAPTYQTPVAARLKPGSVAVTVARIDRDSVEVRVRCVPAGESTPLNLVFRADGAGLAFFPA